MKDPIHDSSNLIVEAQLEERRNAIEVALDADVLAYMGPIEGIAHTCIKEIVDAEPPRHDKLAIILETTGGFIETTERIANTIRFHYETVEFIVVSYAMSAGTVLVMSGDSIYMDYSATLGPIDPQLERPGSDGLVPAVGIPRAVQTTDQEVRSGNAHNCRTGVPDPELRPSRAVPVRASP